MTNQLLFDKIIDAMRPARLPSGLQSHRGQDGQIYFYIDFKYDQERYRQRLGVVSREFAERKLNEIREFAINRVAGLERPDPATTMMTFRELAKLYLDTYLADMTSQSASLSGWRAASMSFERVEPFQSFYDKPAALVSASEILTLRNALLNQYAGTSGRTVRNTLSDLRTIFNFGMRESLRVVHRNPIDGDTVASISITPPEYFELAPNKDFELLQAARDPWMTCAILLGLDLGLRENSILNLRIEDIDLEAKLLRVTVLKGKRRKKKTPEWKPIATKRLLSGLTAQITRANKKKSAWLFPSPRWPAKHVSENLVLREFIFACEKAKFGRQKFHHLRHIFNTRAALCLSEEVRRALSSHESVEASRHYTHLNTRSGALSLLREVSKLDELLTQEGWNDDQLRAHFLMAPNEKGVTKKQLQ